MACQMHLLNVDGGLKQREKDFFNKVLSDCYNEGKKRDPVVVGSSSVFVIAATSLGSS